MLILVDSPAEFLRLTTQAHVSVALFHATWSGPSREALSSLDLLARRAGRDARFVLVDVDVAKGVTARLAVKRVPTVILFADTKEVGRYDGVPGDLEKIIESHGRPEVPAPLAAS